MRSGSRTKACFFWIIALPAALTPSPGAFAVSERADQIVRIASGDVVTLQRRAPCVVELSIPVNLSAGYRWHARVSGGATVAQAFSSATGTPGAPQLQSFSVRIERPGKTVLDLRLARSPSDPDTEGAARVEIDAE